MDSTIFSIILTNEQKNQIRKNHETFGIIEPYNNYLSLKSRFVFLERLFDEILINPRQNNYCDIISSILETNSKSSIQGKCRGSRIVILEMIKPHISQDDYIILDEITDIQNSIFSANKEKKIIKKIENIENENIEKIVEKKVKKPKFFQEDLSIKQEQKYVKKQEDQFNYIDKERTDQSDNSEDETIIQDKNIVKTINIDFTDMVIKIQQLYDLSESLENPQNESSLKYLLLLICTGMRSVDFRRIQSIDSINDEKNEITIMSRFKGEKEIKQHTIKVLILTAQQVAQIILYLRDQNIFHYNGQLKKYHKQALNDSLSMFFREKNAFEKYFQTMHKSRKLYAELMCFIHNKNDQQENLVFMKQVLGHKSLDTTILYKNTYKNIAKIEEKQIEEIQQFQEPEIQQIETIQEPEIEQKIVKMQDQKLCEFCSFFRPRKNFNKHQITCEIKHKEQQITQKQFLCETCKTVQSILNKNQHIKICNKKYNIE